MQGRRIMIVDDEENVLQALKRALIDEDYTIVTARNGKEALDKLGLSPVDIVMSDHTMPSMSGLEFLQQAKQRYPDTIRILITGKSDTQITIEAINRGEIFRFLLKPWNDEELKMTLRTAFEYHDLLSENKRLAATVKKQSSLLEKLERQNPGITKVDKEADGCIVFENEDFDATIQAFQVNEENYSK